MDTRKEILRRVDAMIDVIREKTGHYTLVKAVKFDLSGVCAGKAYSDFSLSFNVQLCEQVGIDAYQQTIAHEVIHLAVFGIYGTLSHDRNWKRFMQLMGYPDRAKHSYNVAGLRTKRVRRYQYSCGCDQGLTLTKGQHTKMQKGAHGTCRSCYLPIKFVSELGLVNA